ncbi:hypothetical protein VE03_07931 [Pseudogymnoascus sp. 23342-1-I1]|nr:hypothetical protein VE03_07931 [Pseudogymnoascus sp. 23342-1-I1]
MSSQPNTVAQAQMAELRFQAAVIEPTEQATASRPSETTGEERQIEPKMASVEAKGSRKVRKSTENPTLATIKSSRARAITTDDADRPKAESGTTDEIYGTDGPVTAESHPHTFSVQFQEHRLAMDADFMGVRSFQNCLESYIAGLSPEKQRSAHRPADTLRRIVEKNPIPPPHYPKNNKQIGASWRHEVRNRWYTVEGKAHKGISTKDSQNGDRTISYEKLPEVPTEEWYAMLAKIHHDRGHHGRDEVFKNVQSITPSISKGFVATYVSCCCLRGKSSPRKVDVCEAFAGEELAKTGKPSKGKKRAIEEADPDSLSPAAKRPKSHSTEPVMVSAGDEQDRSLQNDYSPPQMGVEVPIARADPFISGAEYWQGDDSDWLLHTALDVSELSSLGESIHTQAAVSEQAWQDPIDPQLLAMSANGDNTSHPQSQNAYNPGLSMGLENPSADIHGNISDGEFGLLLTEMVNL